MIEYLPASTAECFVVRCSGTIRGDEYREFIDRVESALRVQGSLNLVLIMDETGIPEWDAIKADAHFGLKDYGHMRRVAYVGHDRWLEWLVRLMSPFTHAEEKMFPPEHLDLAVEWASG
ncbi:MAG: STAS/SEC14 domain-containing protein [Anaerolineae bacterium]